MAAEPGEPAAPSTSAEGGDGTAQPAAHAGREIAQLRIDANFGDSEATEGSVGSMVSGSIQGFKIEQLVIRVKEAS